MILFALLFSIISYAVVQNACTGDRIYRQHIDSLSSKDIAIVPGTAVAEDTPTARCRDRLDMAKLLYDKKLVSSIIVSGTDKETEVMCKYLIRHEVPENCIERDAHGASTYETIARIAEKMPDQTFYFFTQELYAGRSQFLMDRAGIDGQIVCVDTMFYSHSGKAYWREYFACSKAILDFAFYHGNPKHSVKTDGFAKVPDSVTIDTKHHIQAQNTSVPSDYQVVDIDPDDEYDVQKAVNYARTYALKENPSYPVFENNCTNFVSQCLAAGGITMKGKKDPSAKERLIVSDKHTSWYSVSTEDEKKVRHFSTSSSFINTDDFLEYFTKECGYSFSTFDNTYEGKLKCFQSMASRDVLVLYQPDGSIAHIRFVSGMGDMNAYFCANTNSRLDYGIFNINSKSYPRFGILHMSRKRN